MFMLFVSATRRTPKIGSRQHTRNAATNRLTMFVELLGSSRLGLQSSSVFLRERWEFGWSLQHPIITPVVIVAKLVVAIQLIR